MRSLMIFGVIISSLIILTGMAFFKDKYMSEDGVKIVIYKQGKEIPIEPNAPRFKELQEKCERFLESSIDMLMCLVSKEITSPIKNEGSAIEVTYSKPREIEIISFKKIVKADHLLIPFSGEYVTVGKNARAAIYFYGPEPHVGPHSAPRDVTEIITLLKSMGIDMD